MTVNLTGEGNPLGGGKPHLTVIAGGRAELERAALDAVFTDPAQVPLIMARLVPRRALLTQVPDTSLAPGAPGAPIRPIPAK